MGEQIKLTASDNHVLSAYRADPEGTPRGGVVVIQEIFGVNGHIREVCDRYAEAGYTAIAPALFDRLRPGVELGYDEAGVIEGRELVGELGWDKPMLDIWAAAKALHPDGKAAVVGYCWGGSLAFLASCRLDVTCAACYYGRHIVEFLGETPRCPTIFYFGAQDPLIPQENVEKVRDTFPTLPLHVFEGAGHGFNCSHRGDFRPDIAARALDMTLWFFTSNMQ